MSLSPDTRVLLTDALRPPPGYRVDAAIATTYTLDLVALLLAPLSFALHEHEGDPDSVDPVALLEAIRRYSERTAVFCQAGSIAVPAKYRPLMALTEDCIVQVESPRDGATFHPKVWVLRFVDSSGRYTFRSVVLSRNLTFDTSWDTALWLDEADGVPGISAGPLADFLQALPTMTVGAIAPKRPEMVADVATTLRGRSFEVPAGFTDGELLPLGIPGHSPLTFAGHDRMLAISPFVTQGAVNDLARQGRSLMLVSRQDTLDMLGSLPDSVNAYVLQQPADDLSGEDRSDDASTLTGLHAKTYVSEQRGRAEVVTGSANLTSAGLDGNVEFCARLRGRSRDVGVSATWDDAPEAPGLGRLTEPYTAQDFSDDSRARHDNEWALERAHRSLARAGLALHVDARDDDRVDLTLRTSAPPTGLPADTSVRPLSMPAHVESRPLIEEVRWGPVSRASITPYLVVTSSLGAGDARTTRSTVIKADLHGDVEDRSARVLREILSSPADVLRYLVFLLGDPALDSVVGEGRGGWKDFGGAVPGSYDDLVLFEPLVRAAARGDDAIARIEALLRDLNAGGSLDALVPHGFTEIWSAVWAVHHESRNHG